MPAFWKHAKNLRVLFLELEPAIIPRVLSNSVSGRWLSSGKQLYMFCVNQGEAFAPEDIKEKSICINDDIGRVLYSI